MIIERARDMELRKELTRIYETQILPAKINNIKKTRKTVKMVDISVGKRNFIADGLIVHNSAHRYERIREDAAVDFYKKIGEMMKQEFEKAKKQTKR